MKQVAFVRGAFLNNFEGQNFNLNKERFKLRGFSSLYPLDKNVSFPITRLPSIADLTQVPLLTSLPLYHQAIKYLSNRIIGDSQILFGLEKAIDGYDVVDTADPHYFYSYQLAKMRQANQIRKLIVTYCEIIPFNNETVARKKYIKYFTLQQADAFICHTQLSKKSLIAEGIDESKINLVRLGVDLERFKPINTHPSNTTTILFVGRLASEKGVLELYEAFKEIKKITKNSIHLKIVGDGPLKHRLCTHVQQDGLEQSVSIHQIPYSQIHKEYQAADIFILPSVQTKTIAEQYGMVLVEAMACGLPIISTHVGAIAELIEDAGVIVPDCNSQYLIKALLDLINNLNTRKSLSEKSRKRALQYFDSSKTAQTIGTIYSRL